jgi:hypothetical protein
MKVWKSQALQMKRCAAMLIFTVGESYTPLGVPHAQMSYFLRSYKGMTLGKLA